MKKVLVVSPHPDDETLGCGGTILKHVAAGDHVFWLIATKIDEKNGWDKETVTARAMEISTVAEKYEFESTFQFDFITTKLDLIPTSDLIAEISNIQKSVLPEVIYLPFNKDVHSDHRVLVDAFQTTIKWFRYTNVQKVLMYETLSETDFSFIDSNAFKPNVYSDISKYIDEKIKIMKVYSSEMGEYPFPRSEKTMRALATLRGSQSGYCAAEAFQLVFERV